MIDDFKFVRDEEGRPAVSANCSNYADIALASLLTEMATPKYITSVATDIAAIGSGHRVRCGFHSCGDDVELLIRNPLCRVRTRLYWDDYSQMFLSIKNYYRLEDIRMLVNSLQTFVFEWYRYY